MMDKQYAHVLMRSLIAEHDTLEAFAAWIDDAPNRFWVTAEERAVLMALSGDLRSGSWRNGESEAQQ